MEILLVNDDIFLGLQILNPSTVTLNAVVGQHLPRVKVQLRLEAGFVSNQAIFFRALVKHAYPD